MHCSVFQTVKYYIIHQPASSKDNGIFPSTRKYLNALLILYQIKIRLAKENHENPIHSIR